MKTRFITMGLFAILLTGCFSPPTVDTTSEAAYSESIKKVWDSLKKDQKQPFLKATAAFISNGKLDHIPERLLNNLYVESTGNFFGSFNDEFQKMNGLTGEQILTQGQEMRVRYVEEKRQKEIQELKENITSLEAKKVISDLGQKLESNFKEAEKLFTFSDGKLETPKKRNDKWEYSKSVDITNNSKVTLQKLIIEYETYIDGSRYVYMPATVEDLEIKPNSTQTIEYQLILLGNRRNDVRINTLSIRLNACKELTDFKNENSEYWRLGSWQENRLKEYKEILASLESQQ